MAWAWRHSPFTNAAQFAVHLAMADVVNPENQNEFWMSLDKLAAKSRTSRATAKRTIDEMLQSGLLAVLETRPGGTTLYRMVFPIDAVVTYDPAHGDTPLPELTPRTTREGGRAPRARGSRTTREVPRAPRATNSIGTSKELELELEPLSATADVTTPAFDDFWKNYPKRDGWTRGDKKPAKNQWDRLSIEDRRRAIVGAGHYAAGMDPHFVRDAQRFLRDLTFDNWQVPRAMPAAGKETMRERLARLNGGDETHE